MIKVVIRRVHRLHKKIFGRHDYAVEVDFFQNWKATQKNIEWYECKIGYIPKNKYLIGKREAIV